MKSKNCFFWLLFAVASVVNGQEPPVIPDSPVPIGGPGPKGLTNDSLAIAASCNSTTLTVNIKGYEGDVEVTVEDAVSGVVQTTQTEYINWQACIVTDIHALPSGYYVLYVRLDNDDEYTGYFSK